jgi:hypothetical protein
MLNEDLGLWGARNVRQLAVAPFTSIQVDYTTISQIKYLFYFRILSQSFRRKCFTERESSGRGWNFTQIYLRFDIESTILCFSDEHVYS